jgi:hypothetical protein
VGVEAGNVSGGNDGYIFGYLGAWAGDAGGMDKGFIIFGCWGKNIKGIVVSKNWSAAKQNCQQQKKQFLQYILRQTKTPADILGTQTN